MNNILAICDAEKEYAHRLMEYISRRKSVLLKAVAFSNEDSLMSFAEYNRIELLLIGENMLNDRTGKIKASKKIIIREEREKQADEEYETVYKYQAADSLLKEAMSMYDAENTVSDEKRDWRTRKKIIGVYSPAGGTGKTSFALTLGQIMARESAVLYMNMEGFSGLSEIIGEKFSRGLSELLYYAVQSDKSPFAKLSTVTATVQNLDIIPPVDRPEDLHGIDGKSWIALFDGIMSSSSYSVLILDIGDEVNAIAEIADICSLVYVPIRDDRLAEARINEMMEYLKGNSINTEKIKKIRLPFNKASKLGREYTENLIWSELGDYTRKLIKEGAMY